MRAPTSCKTSYYNVLSHGGWVNLWAGCGVGGGEAVDIWVGEGRGVLVQNKESTDFRSPQVGISVNNSPDVTTLILDKILF